MKKLYTFFLSWMNESNNQQDKFLIHDEYCSAIKIIIDINSKFLQIERLLKTKCNKFKEFQNYQFEFCLYYYHLQYINYFNQTQPKIWTDMRFIPS